jgi:hypothetical protein
MEWHGIRCHHGASMNKPFTLIVYVNAALVALVSFYLFIAPAFLLIADILELQSASGKPPGFAFRWHRTLSPRFETWARERVASGRAKNLNLQDVPGTEWPVFSAVFYLWSTEALQTAWETNPRRYSTPPAEYARGAIEAAAALISDPNHATWVQKYWGKSYLERENLFYRMLLINGLTSYQKLLGDRRYELLLRHQVESLAAELDRSPYGLLDDYPGQCYPIDIAPAIAGIRRADAVLDANHAAFAARALRGFEGSRLDRATQLPAYIADSKTGSGMGPARGIGISFMLIWARELWPETADRWYDGYQKYFWQSGWAMAGVREFSRESGIRAGDWFLGDADAGPVLAGYGTTASAFGIGAARANGRFAQAFPLSAEALLASWPLPDGTLMIPRMLSSVSDAPYVGEAILLFNFTRGASLETALTGRATLPLVVYLGLGLYLGVGFVCIRSAMLAVRRWKVLRHAAEPPKTQWRLLLKSGVGLIGAISVIFNPILGLLLLLISQQFPLGIRRSEVQP